MTKKHLSIIYMDLYYRDFFGLKNHIYIYCFQFRFVKWMSSISLILSFILMFLLFSTIKLFNIKSFALKSIYLITILQHTCLLFIIKNLNRNLGLKWIFFNFTYPILHSKSKKSKFTIPDIIILFDKPFASNIYHSNNCAGVSSLCTDVG